ncbi:unnamed protein product [Amoebophrya sp. A25]|nr:unnamed protein product [Amoebophrya sp. A25]|eukprot:GSA25T00010542001.1
MINRAASSAAFSVGGAPSCSSSCSAGEFLPVPNSLWCQFEGHRDQRWLLPYCVDVEAEQSEDYEQSSHKNLESEDDDDQSPLVSIPGSLDIRQTSKASAFTSTGLIQDRPWMFLDHSATAPGEEDKDCTNPFQGDENEMNKDSTSKNMPMPFNIPMRRTKDAKNVSQVDLCTAFGQHSWTSLTAEGDSRTGVPFIPVPGQKSHRPFSSAGTGLQDPFPGEEEQRNRKPKLIRELRAAALEEAQRRGWVSPGMNDPSRIRLSLVQSVPTYRVLRMLRDSDTPESQKLNDEFGADGVVEHQRLTSCGKTIFNGSTSCSTTSTSTDTCTSSIGTTTSTMELEAERTSTAMSTLSISSSCVVANKLQNTLEWLDRASNTAGQHLKVTLLREPVANIRLPHVLVTIRAWKIEHPRRIAVVSDVVLRASEKRPEPPEGDPQESKKSNTSLFYYHEALSKAVYSSKLWQKIKQSPTDFAEVAVDKSGTTLHTKTGVDEIANWMQLLELNTSTTSSENRVKVNISSKRERVEMLWTIEIILRKRKMSQSRLRISLVQLLH